MTGGRKLQDSSHIFRLCSKLRRGEFIQTVTAGSYSPSIWLYRIWNVQRTDPPSGGCFDFYYGMLARWPHLTERHLPLVTRTSLINKEWDVWMTTLKPEGAQTTTKKNELGSKLTKRFIVSLPGIVRFAILHGILCNKSLFKTEGQRGARCQVDTYPGGLCAATPTSSPPSIFASFIFTRPPTCLLHQLWRPQIQLQPGGSGRKQLGSGREEFRYVSSTVSKEKATFSNF